MNINDQLKAYTGDTSIMVIVGGNGRGDPSSIRGRGCLHFALR